MINGNNFLTVIRLLLDYCKLEKGPTDKAKNPDPGGSDQQNLGYKQLKNRKADRTVALNYIVLS